MSDPNHFSIARSEQRILTTHVGSLPRPDDVTQFIYAQERGEDVDRAALAETVQKGIDWVISKQISAGLDIVNDGEMGKLGYVNYIPSRLSGYKGITTTYSGGSSDLAEFPEFAKKNWALPDGFPTRQPACDGPVAYSNIEALDEELSQFRSGLDASKSGGLRPSQSFLSCPSPGVISVFFENQHYDSHEAYINALSDAMKVEYDAIHQAGSIVQIDCPDLAMGRHSKFKNLSLDDFRDIMRLHVKALNHALRDIPAECCRMHLCWGNYEGPHHHDVPLEEIVDIVMTAKPAGLLFEAANPRHAHEWKVWRNVDIPEGKVLIPGVIDSTTNIVEHPQLISDRIVRIAEIVGRENVVAGTDCGFSTAAGVHNVDPGIVWKKFESLAEGAQLASQELWG